MALTQRFESYGSQHPRKTFAFGLSAGVAGVTGIVLAAALTVGIGAGSEDQVVASRVSQGVVAMSSFTDEQVYLAEQGYLALHGTAADTNAIEGAGPLAEYGSLAGPQEAIGMDPYGGFVEPGPETASFSAVPVESYIDEHERLLLAEGIAFNESQAGVVAVTTVESYIDEHERLLLAEGIAFNESQAGVVAVTAVEPYIDEHERLLQAAGVELNDAVLPSTEGIVTASRITDEQVYIVEQDYRSAHGIVGTRTGVRETGLTPELRVGMDDRVSGHRFAWVTPELRAGIEG